MVCSHVLLTRALLSLICASTNQIPFNLHVLGLPPAFVLSQDQTLILNLILPNILLIKNFLGSFEYIRLYIYSRKYRLRILLSFLIHYLL